MSVVTPLAELDRTDLLLAGGKGAHLGALIRAGLPVPPGFCVTTAGYRAFVETNGLQPEILAALRDVQPDQPESLEAASARVRALFEAGHIPDDIATEIRQAYAGLTDYSGQPRPVAVRSSATAEDLPDLSFAGQQDTYLNVVGEESLLRHVVRCWASLWTARAIGYRSRNQIPQAEAALAVVVQEMAPADASGVLFTANPLTGLRSETVIDATLGLGEALVSGLVEPDHYGVDAAQGRILSKTLGAKALSIRGEAGGGTRTVEENASVQQALPDAQIVELARLGQQAARHFGMPQDMEWAWGEGRLVVLQSRAITSLYPLPEGAAAEPLLALVSVGAVQGMLDPFTPLGQDLFAGLVVGVARRFGVSLTPETQRVFLKAGERLFINVTGLFRHSTGRQFLQLFLYAADPASSDVVRRLLDDPRLAVRPGRMKLRTRLRLTRALAPVLRSVLLNLLSPHQGRARLARKIEAAIQATRRRCEQAHDAAALASAVEQTALNMPPLLLPYLLPGVIAGQVPLQLLIRLGSQSPEGPERAMELTRGLPHNVTTEMDLALWAASRAAASDPASRGAFEECAAETLAKDYQAGKLPGAAQQAVGDFLRRYGMRGVAEIDIGRRRWQDDPTYIFQVLKSYLQIHDPELSPEAVFARGAETARGAGEALLAGLRRTKHGWLKARLARLLIHRVRELTGLRETPKFAMIRMFGILRAALLAEGERLAAQGVFEQPDDIFFLHVSELKEPGLPAAAARIVQRRQVYAREMGRRQIPRIMLSDGTAFYDGAFAADSDTVLTGAPVSAGTVEGIVHVVLDPRSAQLAPGEILVCPGTDPAWTPLFLAAGGLVMEVGGMMTHGSVVAREYGIPAVVGVGQATTRLKTGQRVRVDGSAGQVVILDGENAE